MTVQIDIGPAVNARWAQADRGRRVTVAPLVRAGGGALLRPDSRVFAIGSCFAMEIRQALRARGLAVYPDWSDLPLDDDVQVARHPERESINHYDTFVLRQEIERAIYRRHVDVYWHFPNGDPAYALRRWPSFWRDPRRSRVTARTRDALERISREIDRRIDDGLGIADVVVITLGLTEAWWLATGGWACQGPAVIGDATHELLAPHAVTYDENVANLREIVRMLGDKQVVLTVSPVPLGRTWTGQDVVVANATSKATLRAAAAAIVAAHDHVHYWPSWEIATAWHDGGSGDAANAAGGDCFVADARHVRPTVVQAIVDGFLAASAQQDARTPADSSAAA